MAKNKLSAGLKEFFRKRIVALKRKPQMIPMVVLGIAFVLYSFNLTNISDTTARINFKGMGLTEFCTMLFSLLSFVCFINAYPHRKKTNVPMLVIMFVMLGIIVYCDTHYLGGITRALTRPENPIAIDAGTAYIGKARDVLNTHRIIIALGAVLTLTGLFLSQMGRR